MATLKDIAEQTGVSIRTVNRALRDSGYVRAELRERIIACAQRLGYAPDPVAQSLRLGYKQEVVVISHSVDELHMGKIAGLQEALRDVGCALSVVMADDAEVQEGAGLAANVAKGKPRAVAVIGRLGLPVDRLVAEVERRGIPVVVMDTEQRVPAVRIDRSAGVEEAVRHLLARGRRCVVYVGPAESPGRVKGYTAAIESAGAETRFFDPGTAERYRHAVGELLARYPKLDAVQAYSDERALQLMAGCYDLGVRIPDDLAIVGFDDRWAAQYASPPLTTVAQPSREIGRTAAAFLAGEIDSVTASGDPPHVLVPTRLVVRESS